MHEINALTNAVTVLAKHSQTLEKIVMKIAEELDNSNSAIKKLTAENEVTRENLKNTMQVLVSATNTLADEIDNTNARVENLEEFSDSQYKHAKAITEILLNSNE